MKKSALITAAVASFGLAACGGNTGGNEANTAEAAGNVISNTAEAAVDSTKTETKK